MRDQLVEGLRGIGDSSGAELGVNVGLGVGDGGMVGMGGAQDMELDEGMYGHGGHGRHELGGGRESKDHV